MKPLYIVNKKNDWHCQKQKTSRILLTTDFVTWTAGHILDLVFWFSYTDYKFICYLLLMLITFHNYIITLSQKSMQNCEFSLTKDL